MGLHDWTGEKDDGRSGDTTGGAIVDLPVLVRPAFPSVGPMGLAAQGLTDAEYAAIHLRDPDVPGIPEWLRDSIRRSLAPRVTFSHARVRWAWETAADPDDPNREEAIVVLESVVGQLYDWRGGDADGAPQPEEPKPSQEGASYE